MVTVPLWFLWLIVSIGIFCSGCFAGSKSTGLSDFTGLRRVLSGVTMLLMLAAWAVGKLL